MSDQQLDCPRCHLCSWPTTDCDGHDDEDCDQPDERPEDRLPLTLGEWNTDEEGRTLSGFSVCGTCDGGGCRDCIG